MDGSSSVCDTSSEGASSDCWLAKSIGVLWIDVPWTTVAEGKLIWLLLRLDDTDADREWVDETGDMGKLKDELLFESRAVVEKDCSSDSTR